MLVGVIIFSNFYLRQVISKRTYSYDVYLRKLKQEKSVVKVKVTDKQRLFHMFIFFIAQDSYNYRKVLRVMQLIKHRNTSLLIGNLTLTLY